MNDVKIKLCGLRRPADIEYVNEFEPDYAGFVFAKSKRQVTVEEAANLRQDLAPAIKTVGIFVNEAPEETARTAAVAGLDVIQLHGDEDEAYVQQLRQVLAQVGVSAELWKAVRVKDAESIRQGDQLAVDKLLFDAFTKEAYGGTGKEADWELICQNKPTKPFFVAGGLHADNVTEAVAKTAPYGVDVSSGIETDGIKDRDKIKEIVTLLRGR